MPWLKKKEKPGVVFLAPSCLSLFALIWTQEVYSFLVVFCLSQTKEIRVKELGNLSPLNVTIKYVPKLKDFMLQDILKKLPLHLL